MLRGVGLCGADFRWLVPSQRLNDAVHGLNPFDLVAVYLDRADKSAPVAGVGASDRLTVSDQTIPEGDISCFFTPNWGGGLVLTYRLKHDVCLDGGERGGFQHRPPLVAARRAIALRAELSWPRRFRCECVSLRCRPWCPACRGRLEFRRW